MTLFWEYHKPMRPSNSALVAFSAFVLTLFLVLPAVSQVNGPPASVTSPGFGGNPVNGPRTSVTSVGPQGYNPPHHHPFKGTATVNNGGGHHHDHENNNNNEAVGPVWYAVPVPYAADNPPVEDQPAEAEEPSDEQGGPTVFDRRGSGPQSYVPPVKSPAPAHPTQQASDPEEAPPVDPDPPLAPTLFIFKDGRTLEVANYAILGQTIYDLTPGHRRKIALIDLDLEATRKQNDERGVTFQLPQGTHVN
jgi:hypothetical protein